MNKEVINKRIKELAEQATTIFEPDYPDSKFEYFDKEKFAELIIKECIECGNNLANHYINKHSEQEHTFLLASISDYSNEIEKHFGVTHDQRSNETSA